MRSAEIMLEPHPSSVGRARRWLSRQLEEWGLEDLDYDVSVVLSELVTNAVLHARTQIELRVTYGDLLRVEVCDSSERMPSPRGHATSTTTGRGLHLVAALASAWGYEPTPAGKTVWAEFTDIDASRGPRPAGTGAGEATVSALGPRAGTARMRSSGLHCLGRSA